MSKYLRVLFVLLFVVYTVVAVAFWQGLHSFMFAWVLNFMLMMGVLTFTQTFKPQLASNYFDSKEWEAEGRVYQCFWVHVYRKVLVWVGWEKLHKASNPVRKNLEALKHLEYSTRQSEFGHLIIFFIVFTFFLYVAVKDGIKNSLWLGFLNIVLNLYPMGVQRYNRPRLRKAIDRIMEDTTGQPKIG